MKFIWNESIYFFSAPSYVSGMSNLFSAGYYFGNYGYGRCGPGSRTR